MSGSPGVRAKAGGEELSVHVERFGEHLLLERRSSAHTVAAYGRDLGQLTAFLAERLGRAARVTDVDKLSLRSWLASLAEGATPATLSRKLSSVRALFRYLERRGVATQNPAGLMKSPKVRRKMPVVLNQEAAARVV